MDVRQARARPVAIAALVVMLTGACAEPDDGPPPPQSCDPAGLTWIYEFRDADTSPQESGTDIARLTGSAHDKLTSDGASYDPTVSPDGKQVVFARGQGSYQDDTGFPGFRLHIMAADGSRQRPFIDGSYDRLPTWSPNGEQIAFVRVDPSDWSGQLMVVPAAGGTPRAVPGATPSWSAADAPPTWSPSGDRIAWVERQPLDREPRPSPGAFGPIVASHWPGAGPSDPDRPVRRSFLEWSDVSGEDRGSVAVPGWVYGRAVWTRDGSAFVLPLPPADGPGESRLHLLGPGAGELTPVGLDSEVAGITRLPTGQLVGIREGDDADRANLVVVDEETGTLHSVTDLGSGQNGYGTLNPVPPSRTGWSGC